MKNRSGTMVLAALIALSFTAIGNMSYAGKTKEEKQIARAEHISGRCSLYRLGRRWLGLEWQ